MSKIKADLNFTSDCVLTIKDTSGFRSDSNPDGFLRPEDVVTTVNDFKLTDGYFVNVILYNKYVGEPYVMNAKESITKIVDVQTEYQENFTDRTYHLEKDGVYTVKRLFVISKEYYLTNIGSPLFTGKEVIYFDEEDYYYYRVTTNGLEKLTAVQLGLEFSSINVGLLNTYKFVSTCNLNRCNYLLQKKFIETRSECDTSSSISKERDLIFMTLMVIAYLKDAGQLSEVQKLIESIDVCGLVCRKLSSKENDCGCN